LTSRIAFGLLNKTESKIVQRLKDRASASHKTG